MTLKSFFVTPRLLLLVTLVALAVGALTGCGEKSATTLVLRDMRFAPGELHLTGGEPVTLTLINRDGYGHSFDIDALDIHIPLAAGETRTVTFTPEAASHYTFYCAAGGHEKAGMVGTLNVTATAADAQAPTASR